MFPRGPTDCHDNIVDLGFGGEHLERAMVQFHGWHQHRKPRGNPDFD
jgi:hypothetical protein